MTLAFALRKLSGFGQVSRLEDRAWHLAVNGVRIVIMDNAGSADIRVSTGEHTIRCVSVAQTIRMAGLERRP